ncbi:uncharacterized protein LOC135390976 [Ornithodoros turicata]|uniref:uncharacterized protein LOC135390976 n=1 Tax=Ornithodoros turicata TaxID=34597 RepID=UPI003139B040
MPAVCIVTTCPNRRVKNQPPGLTFHSVPNDEPRRSLWLELAGQQNGGENLPKTPRFCQEHFPPNAYRMAIMGPVSKKLCDDVVPSLRLPKDVVDAPSKRLATSGTVPQLGSQEPEESANPRPCMPTHVSSLLGRHRPLLPREKQHLGLTVSVGTQTDMTVRILQERGSQTDPWKPSAGRGAVISPRCVTSLTPAPSPVQSEDEDSGDRCLVSKEGTKSNEYDSCQPRTSNEERKFLVSESCLLQLFRTCPRCSSTCTSEVATQGAMISVTSHCCHGHVQTWESQSAV